MKSVAICISITLAGTLALAAQAKLKPPHAVKYESYTKLAAQLEAPRQNSLLEADPKLTRVNWETFDESIFARAKREKKLILVDMEAVWCHWCHVMEETTYSNSKVAQLINSKFIAVKVDQDSRPDLSSKWEDWGWPATIILDGDGKELVKRQGYIKKEEFLPLLKKISKNPIAETPGKRQIAYGTQSALSKDLQAELTQKHISGYDAKYGAWGTFHKYLDADSVEYSMELGLDGDKEAQERAIKTLKGMLNLIDPVWGGVYQYSTGATWNNPHFEKIMEMQANNLKVYSLGYALYKDQEFLKAAKSIADYLHNFLTSPDGAFYTSQDADLIPGQHSEGYFNLPDKERRALGIPRIDKHVYSRENGWAITAMVQLYEATRDPAYLLYAKKAADWIVENRSIEGGGFSHDEPNQDKGYYLGDTLSMGRASLALYEATADRKWLKRAVDAGQFIQKNFGPEKEKNSAGFVTSKGGEAIKFAPVMEENVRVARFYNLLYHYSGDKNFKALAQEAMRYLATPEIARKRKILVAGILMADRELASTPDHVTILGDKKDPSAEQLFIAALSSPVVYKRIDWYDQKEGPLPNSEVEFPTLDKAAAFTCGDGRCSAPAYEASAVTKLLEKLHKQAAM